MDAANTAQQSVDSEETAPMNLIIRRARRDDLGPIVRMLADDALGRLRERPEEPLAAGYLTAFAAIDADPNQYLIVAELDGAVIGTLQLTILPGLSYQGGKRALIEAVRVDAPLRGQGIGQRLIVWAIEQSRQENCFLVQLTSHNQRADAHRFYERLGFVASHVGMKLKL
jgi:GNAT superfamily N-acetyltransferase